MVTNAGKKAKVTVRENERIAHWAFLDHIRQGMLESGKLKPGEKLIIRDAIDGFFGEEGPTGHVLATDGGCFGNNFGLNRIIAYAPWFTFEEGFVAKIFADAEYWHDIIEKVPPALDLVTDLYGIKFDYHCMKNLFEARMVDNPAADDFLSKDNDKDTFWNKFAGKLWKRPSEPYIGIRFAIAYSQGFRMRHKDVPEEQLGLAKEECRLLLKQLAGWKGMKLLIDAQGADLLALIEAELLEASKMNKEASSAVSSLEARANALAGEKQELYRRVYEDSKIKTDMVGLSRVKLADKDDEDTYDFSPADMAKIQEIDAAIEVIRGEIIPHIHQKSLTDGKIVDLSCKSAITRYALDFFAD